MKKRIGLVLASLIFAASQTFAQTWSFVGPYSNNNLSGSEFETSQMTKVLTSNLAPGKVIASSKYAGLYFSQSYGGNWTNVDIGFTGLDQANAVAFKNSNEVIFGNYHFSDIDKLSYSNRVASYNFTTNTGSNYPSLPTSAKYVIQAVAAHPTLPNVIYAGTSIGLFRYNGSTWTQVISNCFIESIVFLNNTTCFVSGSNQSTAYPSYIDPVGQSLVYVSNDAGNNIFSSISTPIVVSEPISHTEICTGGADIYALTVTLNGTSEKRYLHKITPSGTSYNTVYLTGWSSNDSPFRGGIAYDANNNFIWTGGVGLYCYDIGNNILQSFVNSTFRTTNGNIHYDLHNITIDNNEMFIACDGGLARANISSSLIAGNPYNVYFNRINMNLNVCLINGFSGSEQDPNLYAIGGQDIVNSDIYDANIQQNRYTHFTWENDGALIYKFNDDLMFLDNSSYDNMVLTSFDEGASTSGNAAFYTPNVNPPFSPNFSAPQNPLFEFGNQRTIQDPYRQGRIFEVARKGWPGFYQYDFNTNTFLSKGWYNHFYFPNLSWQQMLIDLGFSYASKNDFYFIFSNRYHPGESDPSRVVKYIGPDIDDCWEGHNDLFTATPWASPPQWQEISPNYATFSSIGGGAVNISTPDLGKVAMKKIEVSPWNPNTVYVAGNFDTQGPNKAIKVIQYQGNVWRDYSAGIPVDEAVTTMDCDIYGNDALYLYTENHVYYRDATMSSWVLYGTGLPQILGRQMEINYKENTVRVGTYGRGIWKTGLKCPNLASLNLTGTVNAGYYEASNVLNNGNQTMAGSPTIMRATNSITLNPGFVTNASNNNYQYLLAVIHGCNTSGSSQLRTEENIEKTAIYEEQNSTLFNEDCFLFPNPNNGKFNMKFSNDEERELTIYDCQGKMIQEIKMNGYYSSIDLTNQLKGIYFIRIKTDERTQVKKVIIE